jgi:hypothetical protein
MEQNVKTETNRIGAHFDGVGDRIARRFQRKDIKTLGSSISNSIMALFTGGSLEEVAGAAGLAMAVSLSTQFVVGAAERIAGSAAVQTLMAALAPIGTALIAAASTIGTTIGTVIPTLAAVAMAIWPALLVAAIVAGIVFLINHPEVVAKVFAVAGDILDKLGKGLARLGEMLGDIFEAAFTWVQEIVEDIVDNIVGAVMEIVDAVAYALRMLHLLEGATKKAGPGGTKTNVFNPSAQLDPSQVTDLRKAAGGWVGLHGPEMAMVGERGPEYITPAHRAGAGGEGHGHDIILDGDKVGRAVDVRNARKARMLPARA